MHSIFLSAFLFISGHFFIRDVEPGGHRGRRRLLNGNWMSPKKNKILISDVSVFYPPSQPYSYQLTKETRIVYGFSISKIKLFFLELYFFIFFPLFSLFWKHARHHSDLIHDLRKSSHFKNRIGKTCKYRQILVMYLLSTHKKKIGWVCIVRNLS